MRLLVFDRTCTVGRRGSLSPVWWTGAQLYRRIGRIDAALGVASWDEAFAWLGSQREPIRELQYWGHGKWGCAFVDEDRFDSDAIGRRARELDALRERLAPDALIWFRTCETLGAQPGHDFSMRLADRLGARVAGHTYIIGFHQSGLHGIAPGMRPDWPADEGLLEGTPEAPARARSSRPWIARTITALHGAVPESWFSGTRL